MLFFLTTTKYNRQEDYCRNLYETNPTKSAVAYALREYGFVISLAKRRVEVT